MRNLNRKERRIYEREVDRSANRSIDTIKKELAFLNAAGNPKYRLVVQSDFRYKMDRVLNRMAFWR